jgi:spermidine/putrescine transport system ATP-binding protein
MLLDEPLSALDLKLRQHMRAELRAIQKRTGVTFIYITHDQGEAFAMSDRIAVMQAGRIEQIGPPRTVYDLPASSFVAQFVGEVNQLSGRVSRCNDRVIYVETPLGLILAHRASGQNCVHAVGDRVDLFIRPEAVQTAPGVEPGPNSFAATVFAEEFVGQMTIIHLRDRWGASWRLSMPSLRRVGLQPGTILPICFDQGNVLVFPAGA